MRTTTAAQDPEALDKLRELIDDINVAMVTTVTPDGILRSRPMVTQEFQSEGELWFFTADDSGKARDLAEEQAVNVCYAEPKDQRYISISGNATIVRDREKAKELWKPVLKAWFPKGLDDPHLALLRVRIEAAEYWDISANRMKQLFETAKARVEGEAPEPGDHHRVDIRATPASG